MLYLEKLILHNFKSFKNATISFSNGFNCIVGPNGSGKSNVCDSLLFAFGEGSLRRMRATSAAQLVSDLGVSKKDQHGRKTSVSIILKGDNEVTVTRIIKPNGKISHRLNGKRMTRQEISDYLRANNCMISDTNTITQGEIVRLLSLNAKEKRGLIDIAAGIKEFDDKKEASERELEKVEEKITATKSLLGERLGFLEELKKEKEAAEKYSAMSARAKSINYTILYKRSEAIRTELKDTIDKLSQSEKGINEISAKIMELDSMGEKLSSERSAKAKALNERSSELNDSNRKLESLKREIAVSESELKSAIQSSESITKEIETLMAELEKQNAKLELNTKELPGIDADISEMRKELEKSRGAVGTEAKIDVEKYEEKMKLIEELSAKMESANREHMQAIARISGLESQKKSAEAELDRISKSVEQLKKSEQEISTASNRANRELSEARAELEGFKSRRKSVEVELSQISERKIALRESLATFGSDTNRLAKVLADRLGNGFYGRAAELCRYDERYAEAINAAAGARLSYFVVDKVGTADKAVKILRENKLGRASFIPLDIISYTDTKPIEEGEPLIGLVEFESRFANAFKFIFSNTYLIGDIKSVAKGSKHRYVTLDGEILEQSGIVSGGFSRSFNYAKAIAELKSAEDREKTLREELESIQGLEDESRQKFGRSETVVMSSAMELENIRASLKNSEAERADITKSIKDIEKELGSDSAACESAERLLKELEANIAQIKEESSALYSRISGRFANADEKENEEKEALARELSERFEKATAQRAALIKENELIASRVSELDKAIKNKEIELKKSKEEGKALEQKINGLRKEADSLEETIRTHDRKSAGMYEEIKKIEEQIAKNGFEKGKLSSEKDRLERESIVMQANRGQLQTRLSDLMAELSGYDVQEPLDGEIDQMEKDLYVLKSELDKMGSINMRAPEMYEEKSKEVNGVQEKIMTLESERNSILSMISQLESKKLEVFNETFNTVNQKFKSMYKSIFPESEGSIVLENPRDTFNSGLGFELHEGKKQLHVDRLSGGEKSMLMLTLIFSILMCRPMSFYIFDEIDTALDKQNSKKLSALIKQLSSSSQFIVVSHNDTLISYADTAIGVAKKNGESNVFGVKIVAPESIEVK
ncbi:MAG: chromosome segregation SMC family protein [Methanothrix sp.]